MRIQNADESEKIKEETNNPVETWATNVNRHFIVEYPVFVVIDLYLITGERLFVKKNISKKGANAFSNSYGKAYGTL